MVACAGNDDSSAPQYPANYDHMIAVAATDSDDQKATFSNYNAWVHIAAPGVDILSLRGSGTSRGTVYDDCTTIISGTPVACPHVSGACAILLSINSQTSIDDVKGIPQSSTDSIDASICQSARLNLYEAASRVVWPKGTTRLDRDSYSCSGIVAVTIRHSHLKGAISQDVTLSTTGGDFETVTVVEIDVNTGVLTGNIMVSSDSSASGDNVLQVSHGQYITATYNDLDDGTGAPATAVDTAIVDCQAPTILNVEVSELTSRSATVTFETDEPTTARIRCGLACGEPYTMEETDSRIRTTHTVRLSYLTSPTDYYFVVDANDTAGNATTDDNAGQCYTFTTPEFVGLLVPGVYPTIQAAIDAAVEGCVVTGGDGIYSGDGNRDIDFGGKAITVRSESGPKNCVIDCQGTADQPHRGFYFHRGETASSIVEVFTITGGHADRGAGIYNEESSPAVIVCRFLENMADSYGGGVSNCRSSAIITNCIFSHNTACEGGGVDNDYSTTNLTNCTFTTNTAELGGGTVIHGLSENITNCIFWADTPDEIVFSAGSSPAVTYSDIQGGCTGTGNIKDNPCFADSAGGNCHLLPDSPAIDAGDPASDWAYEPWQNGSRVNMGACGNTPEATRSPADLDDSAILAAVWLQYDPLIDVAPEPTGDRTVNLLDFAILADLWLW